MSTLAFVSQIPYAHLLKLFVKARAQPLPALLYVAVCPIILLSTVRAANEQEIKVQVKDQAGK